MLPVAGTTRQPCLALLFNQQSSNMKFMLIYQHSGLSSGTGYSLCAMRCCVQVLGVARLGVTVIATFVVCWSPWLTSLDSASQVQHTAQLPDMRRHCNDTSCSKRFVMLMRLGNCSLAVPAALLSPPVRPAALMLMHLRPAALLHNQQQLLSCQH
jgi:hypothetical protein